MLKFYWILLFYTLFDTCWLHLSFIFNLFWMKQTIRLTQVNMLPPNGMYKREHPCITHCEAMWIVNSWEASRTVGCLFFLKRYTWVVVDDSILWKLIYLSHTLLTCLYSHTWTYMDLVVIIKYLWTLSDLLTQHLVWLPQCHGCDGYQNTYIRSNVLYCFVL